MLHMMEDKHLLKNIYSSHILYLPNMFLISCNSGQCVCGGGDVILMELVALIIKSIVNWIYNSYEGFGDIIQEVYSE